MSQYRQGDVLISSIEESTIPKDATDIAREDGAIVLATGDATGHAHAIRTSRRTRIVIPLLAVSFRLT